MKWKAQVRINKHTGEVVRDEHFPDGLCDLTRFSDSEWGLVTEDGVSLDYGCIWVKVEYDDGEPT